MIRSLEDKKPQIDESCFVAESADILGDVTLAAGCSVWYSAVLRGDLGSITIGEGSNIQDNCTLHSDAEAPICIGKDVSVGHNAVVHGAVIGDNTLVGMNSVILNGAVIGKNCIIAAGAMIAGGTHFPDNSMIVGSPAEVITDVYPVQAEHTRRNAEVYRKLAILHKNSAKA